MYYYTDRKINHTIINHTLCVMITKTLTISPQTILKLHGLLIHKSICYISIPLGKEEISLDYVNEFRHNIPLDSIISEW